MRRYYLAASCFVFACLTLVYVQISISLVHAAFVDARTAAERTTARDALDQGREVMAVPGHPFDARASGSNVLIRDGATLVRGAEDILEALERPARRKTQQTDVVVPLDPRQVTRANNGLRDRILGHLGHAPLAEDQLIRDLALPAAEVTASLTELELSGDFVRASGGLLSLRA